MSQRWQRPRTLEERVNDLERRVVELLEFYELMKEKGLREDLPKILDWWANQEMLREYLSGRRSIWRSKWAVAGGVILVLLPIATLALNIYNAVAHK